MVPNRRYFGDGLVVAVEDTREYGDSTNDFLIRRLIVGVAKTELDCCETGWDLVASIGVEICDINESGVDEGYLEPEVEVYRAPFPKDSKLRKDLIRIIRGSPKFFLTDGPLGTTPRHHRGA